ncbi:hypothetical protein BT69DRAFT_1282604 [Atractiella rhizophila]|nr:hypothetical protein BT69DRAFT_1282604 [Atractiella rhizophila]
MSEGRLTSSFSPLLSLVAVLCLSVLYRLDPILSPIPFSNFCRPPARTTWITVDRRLLRAWRSPMKWLMEKRRAM